MSWNVFLSSSSARIQRRVMMSSLSASLYLGLRVTAILYSQLARMVKNVYVHLLPPRAQGVATGSSLSHNFLRGEKFRLVERCH